MKGNKGFYNAKGLGIGWKRGKIDPKKAVKVTDGMMNWARYQYSCYYNGE